VGSPSVEGKQTGGEALGGDGGKEGRGGAEELGKVGVAEGRGRGRGDEDGGEGGCGGEAEGLEVGQELRARLLVARAVEEEVLGGVERGECGWGGWGWAVGAGGRGLHRCVVGSPGEASTVGA
jgi:hypothetical protein